MGKSDIVLVSARIAIFCDSESSHGYDRKNRKGDIKPNRDFWYPKIERNIARDKEITEHLESSDWTVLRFWGREIEEELENCVEKILKVYDSKVCD